MAKTYGPCATRGCKLPVTTYGYIFCNPHAAALDEATKRTGAVSANPVFTRRDAVLDV